MGPRTAKGRERKNALVAAGRAGIPVRAISAETGVTLKQVADAILHMRENWRAATGGQPTYTGETRVYANGVVGYRVRCRRCSGLYWVTCEPTALCCDCLT